MNPLIPSFDPLHALAIGALCLFIVFTIVWAIQLRTQNAGLIDSFWSWGVGFLGVLDGLLSTGEPVTRLLVAVLAGLWGLRLGTHLLWRNHGKPEDGRYRRLREEWGAHAPRNMFLFFQMQVVFALLLSICFLVDCYRDDRPSTLQIGAAIAIWIIAVVGEGIADAQLERFKREPANRHAVCNQGLWRYSRHPNYFFECVHWLTYLVLGLGTPWFFLTFLPPLVMAFLLMRVSGIPITEAQSARNRPGYAEYMKTTSALIPWPPSPARGDQAP